MYTLQTRREDNVHLGRQKLTRRIQSTKLADKTVVQCWAVHVLVHCAAKTVSCSLVHYSLVQGSVFHYSVEHFLVLQCSAVQYSAVQ